MAFGNQYFLLLKGVKHIFDFHTHKLGIIIHHHTHCSIHFELDLSTHGRVLVIPPPLNFFLTF